MHEDRSAEESGDSIRIEGICGLGYLPHAGRGGYLQRQSEFLPTLHLQSNAQNSVFWSHNGWPDIHTSKVSKTSALDLSVDLDFGCDRGGSGARSAAH